MEQRVTINPERRGRKVEGTSVSGKGMGFGGMSVGFSMLLVSRKGTPGGRNRFAKDNLILSAREGGTIQRGWTLISSNDRW